LAQENFQILPLTQLKRARRSLLGKIEHARTRFIVTDYGEAVAELGPLSESAELFLSQHKLSANGDIVPISSKPKGARAQPSG